MEFTRNFRLVRGSRVSQISRLLSEYWSILGFREFIKATYRSLDHYQLLAVPYSGKYHQRGRSLSDIDQNQGRRLSVVEKTITEPSMSLKAIDDTLSDRNSTKEIHIGLNPPTLTARNEQFETHVDVHRPSSSKEIPYIPIPSLPSNYVNANLPVKIRVLHSNPLFTHVASTRVSWFRDKYVEVDIVAEEDVNLENGAASSDGLIIYFHGGGFISMTSFSHEMYTRKWAIDTG